MSTIRIAGIEPESFVDGTGIRYVIFVQGCAHHCENCHNPETWDFNSGKEVSIIDIFNEIQENPLLDGVTFSGGDPMFQSESCMKLAKLIKENTPLNIWCYTGFTYEELIENKDRAQFLEYIDILVDGKFEVENKSLNCLFRGSTNQRLIDVYKSLKNGYATVLELQGG